MKAIVLSYSEFIDKVAEIRPPLTTDAFEIVQQSIKRGCARGFLGVLPSSLILWSMLRWERKVGSELLDQSGIDIHELELRLDDLLTKASCASIKCDSEIGSIDCSVLEKVSTVARQQAILLGDKHVGTEHLLLALFAQDFEINMSSILQSVSYDAILEKIRLSRQ